MERENSRLHLTLRRKAEPHSVSHLLIENVNGAFETKLIQLSASTERSLGTGTEFEMRTQADELAQRWTSAEGYEVQSDSKLPFCEPLSDAITLALKLGFTIIYDNRYKNLDPSKGLNPMGQVRLSTWPGVVAKNGGSYGYALGPTTIKARAMAPPSFPRSLPQGMNTLTWLQEAVKAKESVGPDLDFLIA